MALFEPTTESPRENVPSIAPPPPPPRAARAGVGILALLIAAFVVSFGRLAYIHAQHGPQLDRIAQRQHRSVIPIPARRGSIADARGRILAGTRLRPGVFADPKVIEDKQQAARIVADVVGQPLEEVLADVTGDENRRFVILSRDLTDEQAARIRDADIHGVGLFDEPYRVYPMTTNAAALIGFVAPDGHGVSGLEHQYESWLRGQDGFKTVVRDAGRRAFWLSGAGYQPPRDGLNLVLTIDAVIQEHAERAIARAVEQYQAESAVAVVMRPGNGDILAIVNHPGFDPQNFRDYAPSRYRNRAVADAHEPGSIFKPYVAAAALCERVVRLDEMIDCHNGLWRDGARRLHDHVPHGLLSFTDVVVKSSNIGMAQIGKRLGNTRLHRYITAFGFGSRTGVDLEGETSGIVQPLHRWNDFSTTSLPMGHEIAATPLQLVRGFAALANGGRLVTPRVVRAIVDDAGRVIREFESDEPPPRILPESIAATVKDRMLTDVVLRGTGRNAALAEYQVFGKTGTAQVPLKDRPGYEPRAYYSSFIAGAPAEAPQVVVLVSICKPNASIGYLGGRVAAPVVGEILGHTLAYLNVPPSPPRPSTGSIRQVSH